jgi:hypothetical protein
MSDGRWELLFDARRSARYHDRRRAHFERLHRVTNVTTILLAGVVLMEIGGAGSPLWVRILAVAGALLGAMDLVVGFSRRVATHLNFKRRFIELEQELIAGSAVDAVTQKRLNIEAEEPPIYRALDLLCRNELCLALGLDHLGAFVDIPWYMRWTANWIHWTDAASAVNRTSAPGHEG